MEAILAGMIEGVLVVNDHGRVQLVNGAARAMLRLQDDPEGRHYVEIVRQPDIAAQLGAALRGTRDRGPRADAAARTGDRDHLAQRAGHRRRRGGRRARHARHHRPAPRRSHPARLRRQRLARAAHAADRRARLRRGAARSGRRGRRTDAGPPLPRDHRPPHAAHGAPRARPAAPGAARRRPGDRSSTSRARWTSLFDGVETELAPALEARQQTVVHRIAADAATVTGDPAKLHDALRNLLENATNYAPEESTIIMGAERVGARIRLTVATRAPAFPRPTCRASSNASTASTSRARAPPAIPAAPASASPSSSTSSSCTAAGRRSRIGPTAVRCSRSSCRRWSQGRRQQGARGPGGQGAWCLRCQSARGHSAWCPECQVRCTLAVPLGTVVPWHPGSLSTRHPGPWAPRHSTAPASPQPSSR